VDEHFIVPSIRSREVARTQRSGVGHCEDALKPLDYGNGLFSVHSFQCSFSPNVHYKDSEVKRDGMKRRDCESAYAVEESSDQVKEDDGIPIVQ
jgi:hypothetical protein